MKDGQNGGGSVNPLESKGNIYQHARQSIEGNENGLVAEFCANLGTNNLDVADGEGAEGEVAFHGGEDRSRDATGSRKVVEIGEHAVGIFVAIVEKFSGKLLVTVRGVDGEKQRIFFGENRGEPRR